MRSVKQKTADDAQFTPNRQKEDPLFDRLLPRFTMKADALLFMLSDVKPPGCGKFAEYPSDTCAWLRSVFESPVPGSELSLTAAAERSVGLEPCDSQSAGHGSLWWAHHTLPRVHRS